MNWLVFNGILLNLDHTISIEHAGSKSLDICVAGNPNVEKKCISFETEEDRNAAFDKIMAYVALAEGLKR